MSGTEIPNGTKVFKASVVKVLADLGLVVGRAMVCTEKGEDHYDQQGDHIPVIVAAEAMIDFAEAPVHKVMHEGEAVGKFLGWMLFCEATKSALNIECDWEGIGVIFRPDADVMKKYEDGTYTGFSIGGLSHLELEDAE